MMKLTIDGQEFKVFYKHYRLPADLEYMNKKTGVPREDTLFWYPRNNKTKSAWEPSLYGGRSICTLVSMDGTKVLAEGSAECSMSERFVYKKGREISLGRALKQLINKQA